MTDVGFEPTHPKILVPKTSALDHSANQSVVTVEVKFCKRGRNKNSLDRYVDQLDLLLLRHFGRVVKAAAC